MSFKSTARFYAAGAAAIVLACAGCQNPPEAAEPEPKATPIVTTTVPSHAFTAKEVAGEWRGEVSFGAGVPQSVRTRVEAAVHSNVTTLNQDMSFTMKDKNSSSSGTWKLVGNTVVLTNARVNGIPYEQYAAQMKKANKPQGAIQGKEGRLNISPDGTSLMPDTPLKDAVVMLVRKPTKKK